MYLLIFSFTLFIGCGSSSVVINPDYNAKILNKKLKVSRQSKIIKVLDVRYKSPKNAGSCQVGLFNKVVPYELSQPVSQFLKEAINNIIIQKSDDSLFTPITVTVDSFRVFESEGAFSEKGHFICKLTFFYPISEDSINSFSTSAIEHSSGMDVTSSLESLIYKGVYDCTEKFVSEYNKHLPQISPSPKGNYHSKSDSLIAEKIDIKISKPRKHKKSVIIKNVGFAYLGGTNVASGLEFIYRFYKPFSNKNILGGFGYAGAFYKIVNNSNHLEGSFLSFNYLYSIKYFVNQSYKGFFLCGGLKVSFGNETINYTGGNKSTHFYIGPTLEESLGVSIANKINLEFGIYQIKHFGSVLLPDDFGFDFGLNFRI